MNRTILGIWALLISFLWMEVTGFTRHNRPAAGSYFPTPVPKRTNPSDPTPSPYRNPSDPKPTPTL